MSVPADATPSIPPLADGLTILIPAYNEEKRIRATIAGILEYFAGRPESLQLVVVDDGSQDRTVSEVAEAGIGSKCRIDLVRLPQNGGKGGALIAGVPHARYNRLLIYDADASTPIVEWDKVVQKIREGYDVVIGSRHMKESVIRVPQPPIRQVMGSGYRMLSRMLFGLTMSDLNCGFKCFETRLAQRIFAEVVMTDWTYDVEVLARCRQAGVRIAEIPVTWDHQDKPSTGIKPLQAGVRSFSSLLKLHGLISRGSK